MKLHHVRNVVAIVERGSLRAAAKYLGLAQPAMSRSIRELEQELGVVLFERNKFGMTLTPVGEVFVRRARTMQAEFQRTLDEIEHFKGSQLGTITVAFSGAGLLALLPLISGPFRRKFPNVRIKVVEGTFPMVEASLRDGLIDLYYGPVLHDLGDPALVVRAMFENDRIIVGRRGHPLQHATSLRELAAASWVATPVAVDGDNEVNCVFEAAGLPPPCIAMEAASSMSVITILATTDLLAPLPQQWVKVIKASNVLVQIPVRDVPSAPRICAVWRANLPLTPAAEFLNGIALRTAVVQHKRRVKPLGNQQDQR